ncbi:MAG: CBS domain-containing protein [Anaerolineaceae bacterium]|nr:CBS domain-containing protein [Anaerolineaceae bacterium]
MDFKVRDWMNTLVVFIEPHNTVAEALALMRRRYIRSLIVNKSDQNPEYGIFTSTDVCDQIIAKEQNPGTVLVGDIMTTPLKTVKRDISLKECSIIMKEHSIHHLPVVDDQEEIIGMISASDFLVAAESIGRAPGERII